MDKPWDIGGKFWDHFWRSWGQHQNRGQKPGFWQRRKQERALDQYKVTLKPFALENWCAPINYRTNRHKALAKVVVGILGRWTWLTSTPNSERSDRSFCNTSPVKSGHTALLASPNHPLMGNLSKAGAMTVSEFCLMLLRTLPLRFDSSTLALISKLFKAIDTSSPWLVQWRNWSISPQYAGICAMQLILGYSKVMCQLLHLWLQGKTRYSACFSRSDCE